MLEKGPSFPQLLRTQTKVLVVTDSAAALPSHIQAEFNIEVVPIMLSVDGRTAEEGSLGESDLSGAKITTSAPTPGAYLSAFERPEAADGCLVVTVSAQLSGCFQSATLAAEMTGVPTAIVDSQSAAGGQALVAIAAAKALRSHSQLDLDQPLGSSTKPSSSTSHHLEMAAKVTQQVASRVRLVGVLAGMKHLVRTGRIPAWAGWAADKASIKPVFEIRGGEIKRLRPAHSVEAAHHRIIDMLQQSQPRHKRRQAEPMASTVQAQASSQPQLHLAAVHAQAPADAENLLDKVCHEITPASKMISSFGDALVSAAGPGVSGLAWWWEEN